MMYGDDKTRPNSKHQETKHIVFFSLRFCWVSSNRYDAHNPLSSIFLLPIVENQSHRTWDKLLSYAKVTWTILIRRVALCSSKKCQSVNSIAWSVVCWHSSPMEKKKPSYNNDYAELIFITSLTVSINQFAIERKWIRNFPRMIDIQWVAKNSHICFRHTVCGTYNLLKPKALHLEISIETNLRVLLFC